MIDYFLLKLWGEMQGHIALNSGIAIGAQEILIPEQNIGIDHLINSLKGQ